MKNIFRRFLKNMFALLDDILLILGIALISIGVFKVYIPAGYIILGICLIAFAYIYARSKEGDHV